MTSQGDVLAKLDQAAEQWDRSAWSFGRELQRLRDAGVVVVKAGNPGERLVPQTFTLTDLAERYDKTKGTLSRLLTICDKVPERNEMGASFSAWDEAFRGTRDDDEAYEVMERLGGLASRKRVTELLEMDRAEAEPVVDEAKRRHEKFAADHYEATQKEQAERAKEAEDIDRRIAAWDEFRDPTAEAFDHLISIIDRMRNTVSEMDTVVKNVKFDTEQSDTIARQIDEVTGEMQAVLATLAEWSVARS
jgi:hypothetical protein